MTALPRLCAVDSEALRTQLQLRVSGKVTSTVGLLLEGTCPGAAVGDLVEVGTSGDVAEVIGLRDGRVLMVLLGDAQGITAGMSLAHLGIAATVPCSDSMLGRVLDARGSPLDKDKGPLGGPLIQRPLYARPPGPLDRSIIAQPLHLGVRAIDGLLTLGVGQRMAVLAGAGVGKSRLLGTMARSATADVIVVGLIGERGREVGEFVENVLKPEARRRSVVVAATSDQSPLERMRGAFVATAVAEHFCSQGRRVLLLIDSLTRFAMAQRELGLAMGEPPATRGYTPSVFSLLPKLLERAGSFRSGGSITGLYTVLIEGDDLSDPVGDAIRAITDGHIVLSRTLASRGHFPAIDVLASVSRVTDAVLQPVHAQIARRFRALVSHVRDAEELLSIGAYVAGADPSMDRALQRRKEVSEFLRQDADVVTPFPESIRVMAELTKDLA